MWMTFAMSADKIVRRLWKFLSLALIVSHLLFVSSLHAADQPANASDPINPGSFVGEAAEAVVGRVFGVEGDASDIKYHAFELNHHSPGSSLVRSLVIPGWGQHFNRQKAKGSVFFLTTLGSLYASAHLYNQSVSSYHEYQAGGVKDSSRYEDYKDQRTQSLLYGGVAAILWVVGMVDAHRNAYNPLYSKEPSVDLAFIDEEARITLKKNF